MTRLNIELGSVPSGTGGDTPRSANTKVNNMTAEIYARLDGLGTSSTANIGTQPGNVMGVGAGGWLSSSIISNGNANNAKTTGLYSLNSAVNSPYVAVQLLSTDWGNDPRWQSHLALGISENKAYFRSILKDQTSATPWAEFYHTSNTTRAADGTLKAI